MKLNLPDDIEKKSYEIILNEIDEDYFNLLPENIKPIYLRVIHATADFEFLYNLKFSENFYEKAIQSLKKGCNIVTDVEMVKAGISKKLCKKFKINVKCFMSDEDVIEFSRKNSITRARASMLLHAKEADNGIIVVGNAPTALFQVIEMIKKDEIHPSCVVGVPVGFVEAEESKNELTTISLPYITSLGRKGGTPVAVAIINALLKSISE